MTDCYPPDWAALSHATLLRARWRCQGCDVPHGAWGWRDASGAFHDLPRGVLRAAGYGPPPFVLATDRGERRVIAIVLAAAHVNHDRGNNHPSNLRAWCQRCHVLHDVGQHRRTAAAGRRRAMATLELPV